MWWEKGHDEKCEVGALAFNSQAQLQNLRRMTTFTPLY